MIKYCALCLVLISSVLSGCSSLTDTDRDDHPNARFVVIENIDFTHRIVIDNKSNYEYYESSGSAGWIIGGNVLDENGKPIKYEGGNK